MYKRQCFDIVGVKWLDVGGKEQEQGRDDSGFASEATLVPEYTEPTKKIKRISRMASYRQCFTDNFQVFHFLFVWVAMMRWK